MFNPLLQSYMKKLNEQRLVSTDPAERTRAYISRFQENLAKAGCQLLERDAVTWTDVTADKVKEKPAKFLTEWERLKELQVAVAKRKEDMPNGLEFEFLP